ncbi:MAG: DUF4019 domain-containing protein [Proteobacteria bacterium]|nr:DUF4019 domain-containing protein [Pseudomonadota bacterium]
MSRSSWLSLQQYCYGLFLLCLTMVALNLCITRSAGAQTPKDKAESVAAAWLRGLDQGALPELFDQYAGPALQQQWGKVEFVNQTNIVRIQTGGAAKARTLLGGQEFQHMPDGRQGDFFYFRYRTTFPNAQFFQDVYLENINGAWKIGAYQPMIPVPP